MLAIVKKMREMHKELKKYKSLELKSNNQNRSGDEHELGIRLGQTTEASC